MARQISPIRYKTANFHAPWHGYCWRDVEIRHEADAAKGPWPDLAMRCACTRQPLLALRHLVEVLANDPHNPGLRAGEIISTGTCETWTTRVHGIPLEDIALRPEA